MSGHGGSGGLAPPPGRIRKSHAMTCILIANDHPVVRSGVRSILEAQPGWEMVGEAENGRDAVDQALATRPDIVVLDYALSVMSAIEAATRQIRARVPWPIGSGERHG
jgi:DNA-binding NarL/FixJ family response regulator